MGKLYGKVIKLIWESYKIDMGKLIVYKEKFDVYI